MKKFNVRMILLAVVSFLAPLCALAQQTVYVSATNGSARGKGTAASPVKDIQRAIDLVEDGGQVRIAQGNYLGTLDRGWIEIKGKYVSLSGGWDESFSSCWPQKYITRIQPSFEQRGTVGNAVLRIESKGRRNATLTIEGICFDLGLLLDYEKADPTEERYGCPPGCETGLLKPVGQNNPSVRLLGGTVEGNLVIRNCLFLNGSYFGLLLSHHGGQWEIYNNVFVSNVYGACEITGALNQQSQPHQSKVDFHHNTVLFSWPRTKQFEDMGYGYRFRNGVDHHVHHNIFGCNSYGALDGGWSDSTLPEDNRKICSAHHNLFFMNKGDLVVAGTSGGKWIFVPAKRFDEVMWLQEYEPNQEMAADNPWVAHLDRDYLKGFASLKVMTTESYDPGSAANRFREAVGLNQTGTSTTSVSMYGNRYNFNKALTLFGAYKGYGAQNPSSGARL